MELPTINPSEFSGRSDTQFNKAKSLAKVMENGSVEAAIKNGDLSYDTLSRYLSDGIYEQKLGEVKSVLAAHISSVAINKAINGSERMIEFVLPALSDSFDSGIRRERERAKGVLGNTLFKELLSRGTALDTTPQPDALTIENSSHTPITLLTGVNDSNEQTHHTQATSIPDQSTVEGEEGGGGMGQAGGG